jgi:predicted 2-oxoglutarate/Fe(II)-dependent dioxygenase YbiX
MNLYDYVVIRPNFVPEFIIGKLQELTSQETSPAEVNAAGDQKITDYRSTKWIPLPVEAINGLQQTVFNIHETEFKPIFKTEVNNIEPTQFLKYDINDKYDEHNDSEDWRNGKLTRVVNRDISVLFYLNDDYEGGELEFTRLGLTIKPKKGMMLAFPSYFEFSHRVHPVLSGTRYSLATWIETVSRVYNRDNEYRTT